MEYLPGQHRIDCLAGESLIGARYALCRFVALHLLAQNWRESAQSPATVCCRLERLVSVTPRRAAENSYSERIGVAFAFPAAITGLLHAIESRIA